MSGQTPAAPYAPTNFPAQTATAYKTGIDSNSVAAARIVSKFCPHAQGTPNMTIALAAGSLFDGETLTEVAAQNTATIAAPVSHPRIDRVVIDNGTGAAEVVTGTEAVSPVPPAIPFGTSPIAQIALATSTTAIANTLITDERNFGAMNVGGFGTQDGISSASTCDLGSIQTHNVLITGMTSITSFGSSASTTQPIYLIEFAAALTLVYDPVAMILEGGANIVTAAGDTAIAEDLGSGHWRVRGYCRKSGQPLVSVGVSAGTKFGLRLAYSSTTAITVAAGQAADSTAAVLMTLGASATLSIATSGAANKLDAGTKSNNTWYHVFLISGSSGTATLASLSATAPTLPSGYTYFRRIGSLFNGTSGIVQFTHVIEHDTFYWSTVAAETPQSIVSNTLLAVTVPTGVKVQALIRAGNNNAVGFSIVSPDESSQQATTNDAVSPSYEGYDGVGMDFPFITTNTSAQVVVSVASSTTVYIYTRGWVDHCGRFG